MPVTLEYTIEFLQKDLSLKSQTLYKKNTNTIYYKRTTILHTEAIAFFFLFANFKTIFLSQIYSLKK